MTGEIINDILRNAKPYFQVFNKLNAKCPKCNSQLLLKYRCNQERDDRNLSIIFACSNNCDKEIWNTKAKQGFTHWWLDGPRDREGYERIVSSLPEEERKLIKELELVLGTLNDVQKLGFEQT